jgi:hypothetical protein
MLEKMQERRSMPTALSGANVPTCDKPFVVQFNSSSLVGMIVALSLVQVNSQRLSRRGERENATPNLRAEGETENETDSFVAGALNEAV